MKNSRPAADANPHLIEPPGTEPTPKLAPPTAQITFLYYRELEPVASLFEKILAFELVADQGWAKIYRVSGSAFLGIVSGEQGFHQPQDRNAVLITLVVEDAAFWFQHLKDQGVRLLTQLQSRDEIGIHCFFFEDPGGYTFEVQQFLDPVVAELFSAGLEQDL